MSKKQTKSEYPEMKTATFKIKVQYDPKSTEVDSLATALDKLLDTALSTPGILDEYGCPELGSFVMEKQDNDRVQLYRCKSKGHVFESLRSHLPAVCPVCRKENGGDCGGIWLSRYDEISFPPNAELNDGIPSTQAPCSGCGGTGQDDPPPGKYHGICQECNGTGKKNKQTKSKLPFAVEAECHSDDRVMQVQFDAAPWLAKASCDDIVKLVACEWKNDYPADEVAIWTAADNEDVAKMFSYLEMLGNANRTMGFECSVNGKQAMKWIKKNRQDIYEKILKDA